jgi:threonine synthase
MALVDALVCTECGAAYEPGGVSYTCPEHDGVTGVLDVRYDEEAFAANVVEIRQAQTPAGSAGSMWRYASLLPVDASSAVSLGAGGTPLLGAPTLGEYLGVDLWVKDETGNPTGSNKDRGSAVVASRAVQKGHDVVTCASTGNAAASLSGYAARAGLDCAIFVPDSLPEPKAVQPMAYGATVFGVDGDYADAFDLCRTVADRRGWYNRSAAVNPYAVEGKRTLGFEIAEAWPEAPDWVVVPMGNGCTLAGIWKGLRQFARHGVVDGVPRMLGVQSEDAAAIHGQFHGDAEVGPDGGRTIADSIDVTVPHNARKACRALHESGGTTITVGDGSIQSAQRRLGSTEGVFVEPASAAGIAGLETAIEDGIVDAGERVVVVATGTGLKDPVSVGASGDELVEIGTSPADVPDRGEW